MKSYLLYYIEEQYHKIDILENVERTLGEISKKIKYEILSVEVSKKDFEKKSATTLSGLPVLSKKEVSKNHILFELKIGENEQYER